MKIMNRKLIGLLVIFTVLATIPLAAGASQNELQPNGTQPRTFVSGFIVLPPRPAVGGAYSYFFALSVRAGQIGGDYHIYRLQPVFIRSDYNFHGIATFGFIVGWFDGPIGISG